MCRSLSNGNNTLQINATHGATVNDVHIGDVHHHQGFSVDDMLKLAKRLTAEKGEKDALLIKSLQETIQALTQQNNEKYDIRQALDLLEQGNTEAAESIFESVAAEAHQKGIEANLKEAEALRHLGALAFLHDTGKALTAYQRSTELDPQNPEGWNRLGLLYNRIGRLEDAENSYQSILTVGGVEDSIYRATAYGNLGNIYFTKGDLARAIEYYKLSLELEEELNHKEGMANAYGSLANVYQAQGDLTRAMEYNEKSLAINQELERKSGIAIDYGNLGSVYLKQGDLTRAIEYYQSSLALEEELHDKQGIAWRYGNLGNAYWELGDLDRASEYHQKALVLNQELEFKQGIAHQYGNLGNVYFRQGDLVLALEYYQKALILNKELGRKQGISIQYSNLGSVYHTQGDLVRASEYHEKSLLLEQELDNEEGIASQYRNLGLVYYTRGDLDRAIDYWRKSLDLYTKIGAKLEMAKVQSWLDEVQRKQPN